MPLRNPSSGFLFPTILLLVVSCTIIKDSDITTADELKKIKLKSIKIDQDTNSGKESTTINLLYDSTVNIIDTNTGSTVVRKTGYAFPSLGNFKLKFRSGSTATLKSYVSYLAENKPYTFVLYENDSAIEIYRFRYDATGRLSKIITTINPVDNEPILIRTNDSLIYNSNENITSIIRRSPDAALQTTITIGYGGSGTSTSVSSISLSPNHGFSYEQMQGDCPNNSNANICTGYNIRPTSGSGSYSSYYTISTLTESNVLHELNLIDTKIQGGQISQREYDTYYFHPLMLLRNEVSNGDFLLIIYMIDWLEPGVPLTNTNFTRNDFVTFDFQYGF
jgi:hypothetical protein